jgi:hypothetical protein
MSVVGRVVQRRRITQRLRQHVVARAVVAGVEQHRHQHQHAVARPQPPLQARGDVHAHALVQAVAGLGLVAQGVPSSVSVSVVRVLLAELRRLRKIDADSV